ncbi:DUF427 domain-containing protein [Kitasatospora sp. SUK 42]|uniref:DUF427 domain-containing protein n=1 Tax=Kitasatospora sp. SUK 42 TaxID=1588882 RepID=UPI001C313461|nr:DUF427 domain-containing protein [Kitasatospora sp. SUK 42]MBV2156552.1 DUF427 domain-containing protein [Kitasatospora sp. SUK 42]
MSNPSRQHRVTTVRSTQTVTVEIDGTVVAKSERPLVLFETGLPPRYYLPPEDVELALFEATDTHTTCPFKGEASYWSYVGADGTTEARTDVVWGYPDPLDAVAEIAGHLSFYDDVATIHVEGELPAEPPAA